MAYRDRLKVLIVDDQQSMRQLMVASLHALGVKTTYCAEDGVEALTKLRSHPVDLLLLDAEMPRMNGLETLEAMRSDEKLARVPVVMVTGRAEENFVQRARRLNIEGYLVKPVSASALGARIDAVARKVA